MKTVITIAAIVWSTLIVLDRIDQNAVTQKEYDDMRERLIISEALVKKCAERDTIDIMQYVRDVKREMINE